MFKGRVKRVIALLLGVVLLGMASMEDISAYADSVFSDTIEEEESKDDNNGSSVENTMEEADNIDSSENSGTSAKKAASRAVGNNLEFGTMPELTDKEKELQAELDEHTPSSDTKLPAHATIYSDGTLVFYRGTYENASRHGEVVCDYEKIEWNPRYFYENPEYNDLVKHALVYDVIAPYNSGSIFLGMSNLESVIGLGNIKENKRASHWRQFFQDCDNLKWVDLSSNNFVEDTDLYNLFSDCVSLTYIKFPEVLPIPTKLSGSFERCKSLRGVLDFSSWDLSQVINLSSCFWGLNCDEINFGENTLESATDINSLFYFAKCKITFSGTDVFKNVNNCNSAFYNYIFSDLDLSNWNLFNCTNIGNMFYDADIKNGVILGELPGACKSAYNMFYGFKSEVPLNFSGVGFENANCSQMFMFIDVPKVNFSGCSGTIHDASGMFRNSSVDAMSVDLRGVNLVDCNCSYMFNSDNIESIVFGNGTIVNAYRMFYWANFHDTNKLPGKLDLGQLEFKDCNCNEMFYCCGIKEINNFNKLTGTVYSAVSMFYFLNYGGDIDLSGINWSKCNSFESMFKSSLCSSIKFGNSAVDLGVCSLFRQVFYGAEAERVQIKIVGTPMSSGSVINYLFYNSKVKSVDFSGSNVSLNISNYKQSIYSMFYQCLNLEELDLSWLNNASSDGNESVIYNAPKLNKLTVRKNLFLDDSSFKRISGLWKRMSDGKIFDAPDFVNVHMETFGQEGIETYCKVNKVSLNTNGGLIENSKSLSCCLGESIDLPVPTKKGYTFDGWYTEKRGGEKFNGTVTQFTYYAHWTPINYTLVLKPNGVEGEDISVNLTYSEDYKLSKVFDGGGLDFKGWNTKRDGTGESYNVNELVSGLCEDANGTVVLYAQWNENGKVHIVFTGDEVDLPDRWVNGGEVISVAFPTRQGYSLSYVQITVKYSSGNSQTTTSSYIGSLRYEVPDSAGIEVIEMCAKWRKHITVIFQPEMEGYENFSVEMDYGTAYTPINYGIDSKTGKKFLGWFSYPYTGDSPITSRYSYTKDGEILKGKWAYIPQYKTDGGQLLSEGKYTIVNENLCKFDSLPEVSRQGYKFIGWKHNNSIVKEGDTVDLSVSTDIVAIWEKKELDMVLVTFLKPEGSYYLCSFSNESSIDSYVNEDDKYLMYVPKGEKLGYLAGIVGGSYNTIIPVWKDQDGNVISEDTIVTKDLVLSTDLSKLNNANFKFNSNGGSYVSTMYVRVGYPVGSVPSPKKEGYIFDGWYGNAELAGEKLTESTVVEGSVTWYAKWKLSSLSNSVENQSYSYSAEWVNSSTIKYPCIITNENDRLVFKSISNSALTASLHIRFELNESAHVTLPKGSVKIRLPQYVWKDWDDSNVGTCNIESMLTEYKEDSSGSRIAFSWLKDGNDYILLNNQELSGNAGVDITVGYNLDRSWDAKGGALRDDCSVINGYEYMDEEVPVEFTIDSDLNGSYDVISRKVLNIEFHSGFSTFCKFGDCSDYKKFFYLTWQDSWGTKPADADDYFYISFPLNYYYSSGFYTQPTSVSFMEYGGEYFNPEDKGVVLGVSNDLSYNSSSNSYSSYKEFYVKYPKEMLNNIPATGLKLHLYLNAFYQGKSGYTRYHADETYMTIYSPSYPSGVFGKNNWYSALYTPKEYAIDGGQEDLLNGDKLKLRDYSISYSSGSSEEPIWDDESKTYSAKSRRIRIEDGAPIYSSGEEDDKYTWSPASGNIKLSENDYVINRISIMVSEYDSEKVGNSWLPVVRRTIGVQNVPVEIYVKERGESEWKLGISSSVRATESNGSVSYTFNKYGLQNVVDFRVECESSAYKCDIYMNVEYEIYPTKHIQKLIREDVNSKAPSIIKNIAEVWSWDSDKDISQSYVHTTNKLGDNEAANNCIYELNISKTEQIMNVSPASNSNVSFNVEDGVQDIPILAGVRNYNNANKSKELKSGKVYQLLPRGTSVDPDTIFLEAGATNSSHSYGSSLGTGNSYDNRVQNPRAHIGKDAYSVSFEENYQGRGRTLMIVSFNTEGAPIAVSSGSRSIIDEVGVFYKLHTSYENLIENGTTLPIDGAFVNTSEGMLPYDSFYGKLSSVSDQKYFESLDAQYSGRICYASNTTNYIPVDAFSWKFDKTVKGEGVDYLQSGKVLTNSLYTYRLSYTQSPSTESSQIVFYDVLDRRADGVNGSGTKETDWSGTFESIDVSGIANTLTKDSEDVKCNPIVYYSTEDKLTLNVTSYDVTKSDIWSTTCPEDKSTITAIAVDCSKDTAGNDFILKGMHTFNVYITMRSPKAIPNGADSGKLFARNTGRVICSKNGATPTWDVSSSEIALYDVEPTFHKSSNPATGTMLIPSIVHEGESLDYYLYLENPSDEFNLSNGVIRDTIPEGLNADYQNMTVKLNTGEERSINGSPYATYTKDGKTLTFNIIQIPKSSRVTIKIPCTIIKESGLISNTGTFVSINGIEKNIPSETIIHEVVPTGLSIFKVGPDGKGLSGADISVFNGDGELVENFKSDGTVHDIKVRPGIYKVRENEAPENYFIMDLDDKVVMVDRIGDIYDSEGNKLDTVRIVNETPHVKVFNNMSDIPQSVYRKEDIDEDGKPKEGTSPVDSFTSDEGNPHNIDGLPAGEYVVIQESVPDGYNNDGPKAFEVPESPELVQVYLNNYPVQGTITINKYNENFLVAEYLSGADFTITGKKYDENSGDYVDIEPISFTTNGESQKFTLYNGKYALTETEAPEGYGKARPISFEIKEGKLVVDDVELDSEGDMAEDMLSGSSRLHIGHDMPEEIGNTINVRNLPKVGSLSITKKVKGNAGNKSMYFPFKMSIEIVYADSILSSLGGEGTSTGYIPNEVELECIVNGIETAVVFTLSETLSEKSGIYCMEFPMKDGDTMIFPNSGLTYKVEELDSKGHTVSKVNAEGSVAIDDVECVFTNTLDLGIPTGVIPGIGYGVFVLGLCGMAIWFRRRFSK